MTDTYKSEGEKHCLEKMDHILLYPALLFDNSIKNFFDGG